MFTKCDSLRFLLLAAICVGCGSQQPSASPNPPSSPPPGSMNAAPSKSSAPGDIVVLTLDELDSAMLTLVQDHPRRTIEVTGWLDKFDKDFKDNWCYSLRKAPDVAPMVMCLAAGGEPWASAVPGQTITLRGDVPDGPEYAKVAWKVVKTQTDPAPVISSKQLAEAFAADAQAAHDKYTKKYLYITGTVTEMEVGKNAFDEPLYYFFLDGADSLRVQVGFKVESKAVSEKIMVGQPLVAMCDYNADGLSLDLQQKAVPLWGRPVTVPFPVEGVTYGKND